MNHRLTTHYKGICKTIDTGQTLASATPPILQKKYIIETEYNESKLSNDLQEVQKIENENINSQTDFFNYNVIQNFPLLITTEDLKKGLENKTIFLNNIEEIDETDKKIQIDIKIKKIYNS